MRTNQTDKSRWQRVLSMAATVAASAVMAFALTACGGDDTGGTPAPTVAAPGVPTNFNVDRTPEATLSATVTWTAPTTGGTPATFEIYRSTTAGTVFQAANHLISIPAIPGKTSPYTFVDNSGLTRGVETYWVVSAKNAGGETPTAEDAYTPMGGGGHTGFGNNLSAALIFADDIGIGGAAITGSWTPPPAVIPPAVIDYATGLRPLEAEAVTVLPYLDPGTTYTLDGLTYYKQKTASTWQGQWVRGDGADQHVTAKWGDNLISQRLTATSVARIEMVLSKPAANPMTSYFMQSLYGSRENEVQGTDGTTYVNPTAFVFAANARLRIEKVDGGGAGTVIYNNTLWTGDGPGNLGAEVNVAGNFTYGFVWRLSTVNPAIVQGIWRLTFSLDDNAPAPAGTPNHTFIDTAANGVLDNPRQVHIDIVVQ